VIHTGSAAIDPARLAAVAAGESEAFAASHPASRAAHDAASVSMAGGVPMPWMARFPTPFPIFCDRAEGSHVVDVDGHDYVDFCLGDSAAMTGHAPPAVVAAVAEQAARGFTSLLPDRNTAAVGAVLARRFGLPLWQLCLSATDANRFVIRLAREITGRPKVLVFDHCYHGTVDEALVTLDGTGVVARADLIGPGADPAITTVVVPFNDLDALREALATGEVACVLTEPALTNVGIVPPVPGFLDGLRAATSETGTLLVIDETHTMCMGPGGYTARHGLAPDLLTVGKSIGGGFPVGAYGFTAAVAERIERSTRGGPQIRSKGVGGTVAGNALSAAAVRAAMEHVLTPEAFEAMERRAVRFTAGVEAVIDEFALPWHVTRLGCRAEYQFTRERPTTGSVAAAGDDRALSRLIHLGLVNRGVLMTPFHCMALMAPTTTDADVDRHTAALRELAELLTR